MISVMPDSEDGNNNEQDVRSKYPVQVSDVQPENLTEERDINNMSQEEFQEILNNAINEMPSEEFEQSFPKGHVKRNEGVRKAIKFANFLQKVQRIELEKIGQFDINSWLGISNQDQSKLTGQQRENRKIFETKLGFSVKSLNHAIFYYKLYNNPQEILHCINAQRRKDNKNPIQYSDNQIKKTAIKGLKKSLHELFEKHAGKDVSTSELLKEIKEKLEVLRKEEIARRIEQQVQKIQELQTRGVKRERTDSGVFSGDKRSSTSKLPKLTREPSPLARTPSPSTSKEDARAVPGANQSISPEQPGPSGL